MKTLEDLAREACEAASLPPAITAHPGVKDALRRHAALVRAQALDEAAAVCASLWRIDGQFSADEFAAEVRALKEST